MSDFPQIDAMRMGVDYRFPVRIRQFTVMLRPLSVIESTEVAQQVADRFSQLPPSRQTALTEAVLLAQETLSLASTRGPGTKDPQLNELMLGNMTNDELQFLHNQYVNGCDRVNPALETITAERIEELVEEVKKKPDQSGSLLIALSSQQLVQIVQHFLSTTGD